MKIIFVRHGEPDYTNDSLTPLGHLQAKAAAQRLSDESIQGVYSSSCGRAVQTAGYIADVHNMQVEQCRFMREMSWDFVDGKPINPWAVAQEMVRNGQDILSKSWDEEEPFGGTIIASQVKRIGADFDCWLANFGYKREGNFYRVCENNSDNVVMVSHGGSSSAVMSHIFNLPFPFVCSTMGPDFTGITVVVLHGKNGTLISPKFEIMKDARHIAGIVAQNE